MESFLAVYAFCCMCRKALLYRWDMKALQHKLEYCQKLSSDGKQVGHHGSLPLPPSPSPNGLEICTLYKLPCTIQATKQVQMSSQLLPSSASKQNETILELQGTPSKWRSNSDLMFYLVSQRQYSLRHGFTCSPHFNFSLQLA